MDSGCARAVMTTPIGSLTVTTSRTGLRQLGFGAGKSAHGDDEADGRLKEVWQQLEEYFAGERRRFDVPLDWSLSSGWALQVRRTLYESVPYGQTVSYSGLAELAGRPDGARAVGGIMAGNPIALVVPCHRVVAADGGLGGFGGSGGTAVETKRRLLALEGSAPPTLFD
ncbi:MAG: methylated-DNA--[protein]-cysteine S-methyltransferase [Stackebrandtia sp.]